MICVVDRDLNAHLDKEAEIDADDALIELWIATEYCRVTQNGGAIYDEYFKEAVYGAGHEVEHGALVTNIINAGTVLQKLDAVYDFKCQIEEWFMLYLAKKADENRALILKQIKEN